MSSPSNATGTGPAPASESGPAPVKPPRRVARAERLSHPVRAIGFVLAGMAFVAMMDAVAKWLAPRYPVIEIMFFRALFGLLPLSLAVWHGGGFASLRVQRPQAHLIRMACGLTAMFCFFTALKTMRLADATAIALAAPLVITALSGPMLGERIGPRRWGAVAVGFLGVVIMLRPSPSGIAEPAALLAAVAALAYGLLQVTTRHYASTETMPAMTVYYGTGTALVAGLAVPFVWVPPTAIDLATMLLMGLLGGCGMICITQAYRHGEASAIAPFDYSALVWATLIGFLVWHEFPDAVALIGAGTIVASGLYVGHRAAVAERDRQ
jgi:drug/metabolite transporter (DMT)-like permease